MCAIPNLDEPYTGYSDEIDQDSPLICWPIRGSGMEAKDERRG